MKKLLFAILTAMVLGACSSRTPSDNGLKLEDVQGKWSVFEIYNLYFTDSWDNIEQDLGLDYIYAVFNSNYSYSGKFNKDIFTGIFEINGWSIVATASLPEAKDENTDPGGDNTTTITYVLSDMKMEDGIMTATADITFAGSESGTMTVRMKRTEEKKEL